MPPAEPHRPAKSAGELVAPSADASGYDSSYLRQLSTVRMPSDFLAQLEDRYAAQSRWLQDRDERWDVHDYIEARSAEGPNDTSHTFADGRSCWITVPIDESGLSCCYFALTQETINRLRKIADDQGGALTAADVVNAAESLERHAITPFSRDALNRYNALFYSLAESFNPGTGPAPLFDRLRPFHSALVAWAYAAADRGNTIRIKDLCSGKRIGMWHGFAHLFSTQRDPFNDTLRHNRMRARVTLSDFTLDALPDELPKGKRVSFEQQAHNLLGDWPYIEPEDRYNLMVSTYGFDGIWGAEDICYQKVGERWFIAEHRLVVPDWHPRRERILEAISTGGALPELNLEDIRAIQIETRLRPVEIEAQPYGRQIADRLKEQTHGTLHFPGELIRAIEQAIHNQLSPDGRIYIADAAIGHDTANSFSIPLFMTSNLAAKFRAIDFVLAESIIKELGYRTKLWPGAELIKMSLSSVTGARLLAHDDNHLLNSFQVLVAAPAKPED